MSAAELLKSMKEAPMQLRRPTPPRFPIRLTFVVTLASATTTACLRRGTSVSSGIC
ncbi:hypothetical protein HanRHA438_Chr17g0838481 [Helianthus annuus]|nr:hypothetical protein HanRHA438_Chr17g0838481 [Helianthus annuus]